MTVVVSPQARDDIREAYRHLAADNPEAADHYLARVAEIIGLLVAGGVEGRFVRLGDGRTVRSWPIPPYRLYYRGSPRTPSRSPGSTTRPVGQSRDERPVAPCRRPLRRPRCLSLVKYRPAAGGLRLHAAVPYVNGTPLFPIGEEVVAGRDPLQAVIVPGAPSA